MLINAAGNVPGKKVKLQPIIFISDHAVFIGTFLVTNIDLVF
jgi:hypothetical protein